MRGGHGASTQILEAHHVPAPVIQRYHDKLAKVGSTYVRTEEDRKTTCESTDKQFQRSATRKTTAGILMFVYSCGIIFDMCELFGAESASQVYARLVQIVLTVPDEALPSLMFYDDGCGLRKFAELRKGVNHTAARVWNKIGRYIYVDRFHWVNHAKTLFNKYCWTNCDPNSLPDSKAKIDSEVCEQTFSWLARYKHTARYMRPGHFLFFMLVLCDMKNTELCRMAQPGVKRQF